MVHLRSRSLGLNICMPLSFALNCALNVHPESSFQEPEHHEHICLFKPARKACQVECFEIFALILKCGKH